MRPVAAIASSTALAIWSSRVTSICTHTARRPSRSISPATGGALEASRRPSTTSAPACASASAIASPRPRAAPVTRATRPLRSKLGNRTLAADMGRP